jgi:hypothetical protein
MAETANTIRVLAFDIGIKNLAYCILEKVRCGSGPDASGAKIIAWENVNLLLEGVEGGAAAAAKPVCATCGKGAKWAVVRTGDGADQQRLVCARHVPADRKVLAGADGKPLKTLPAVGELKTMCEAAGLGKPASKPPKKEDWVGLLATRYALPVGAVVKGAAKVTRAMGANVTALHDGILAMILDDRRYDTFMSCDAVLLENQPVLKNPTMKTVQILLFATLRDNFKAERDGERPLPPFHLVHAGKKVQGVESGDAGYTARKQGSEERAKAWLSKHATGSVWERSFLTAGKKSDLADALCMCLDYGGDGGGSGSGSSA